MQAQIKHRGEPLDELNLTVPLDMKQKIWDGKFVEMSDLRRKGPLTEEKVQIFGLEEADGVLSLKPVKPKQKSALSIRDWTTGFHTYMSVRLSKFPNELQGMLSYVEQICEAARDHPGASGWREYDEKFRIKKAADPVRPWGVIDGQLWLSIFTLH